MAKNTTVHSKAISARPKERNTSTRSKLDAYTISLENSLSMQLKLLEQIQSCVNILHSDPRNRAVLDWKEKLEFLLSSASETDFNTLIEDRLGNFLFRTPIGFDLPTDANHQLLVGLVYAEASSTPGDDDEKRGIAAAILNMAHYATYTEPKKKCYNTSFGDGTVLSAIKKGSMAYNSPQWNKVMAGDALKAKADLENSLIPTEVRKLKACVESVAAVADGVPPIADTKSSRNLLQFNQADNSPPSPRQERVAKYGIHTFYAFIKGRECQ